MGEDQDSASASLDGGTSSEVPGTEVDSSKDSLLDTTLETPVVDPNTGMSQSPLISSLGGNNKKKPKPTKKERVKHHLHKINLYSIIFGFILLIAVGITVFSVNQARKESDAGLLTSDTLTPEELAELKNTDTKVGDPKQTLTIESNTILNGKVLIRDNLDVAGAITVGGALSLPGLTVSGVSNFDTIQIGRNLSIGGNTSIQGQLSVQDSLTVSGGASFGGAITAPQITINQLQLSQDLLLNRHIDVGGPIPSVGTGSGVGSGGTVSINGGDTAGTVTINVGTSPSAGVLANITFAASFKATPHVIITPSSSSGAALNYYVTRSSTGFSIATTNAASASTTITFDYIVLD